MIDTQPVSVSNIEDWIEYYMNGGELPDDIIQRVLSMALAHGKNLLREPVARLHIRLDEDGLDGEIEVLDGQNLQVEDSPVDLYLK